MTQDARSSFAQLTVRVRAAVKFAAYDGKRRLVAGDPEREVPVQDVWVLERSFREEPTSRWRVAGGVPLPPDGIYLHRFPFRGHAAMAVIGKLVNPSIQEA